LRLSLSMEEGDAERPSMTVSLTRQPPMRGQQGQRRPE